MGNNKQLVIDPTEPDFYTESNLESLIECDEESILLNIFYFDLRMPDEDDQYGALEYGLDHFGVANNPELLSKFNTLVERITEIITRQEDETAYFNQAPDNDCYNEL